MALASVVLIALLVLILPGFLISFVAGAKAPAALAVAPAVTFGVVGVSAWMWGATSAPFNWLTFFISMLLALAAAAAWRWMFARRARRRANVGWRRALWPGVWRERSLLDPFWVLPAAGVVAGSWMIISDRLSWLVRLPHGVGNIVQGWDSQWHANVVRYIMEEGVASPTRMGELQNLESHAQLLYPTGFHALVALFGQAAGLDPIPAVNIASTVFPGFVLPLSMACLVLTILRSRGLTAQIAAGLAAAAIYVAPPILWIGDYVGMWPYLVAVGLVGSVIWVFCEVPGWHALAFPAALAFVGALNVHPSVVTYIAVPVALFWLTSLLLKPARSRIGDLAWLAGPAVAGVVLFLPQVLAGSAQAEEVSGWATPEDKGYSNTWAAVWSMDTRHVDQFFSEFVGHSVVTLWVLGGLGAAVALVWRGQIWPILFTLISAAAAVNALEPIDGWWGDTLAIIGNLHYNTAHRLVMPVAMMLVAGAAVGVAAIVRLLCLAPLGARWAKPAWLRATAVASIVVAVAAGSLTMAWAHDRTSTGAKSSFALPRTGGRMVNDNDLLAFDWLATQPAAWEGYTMGEPADGYSWLYAYNGVPTIGRHYQWPLGGRGSSTDILFWRTSLLGEGVRGESAAAKRTKNIVDKAAEDLNVSFILSSPEPFWYQQYPAYEQTKALWASEGATPVYRKGTTVIFALNDRFSRAEIEQMRKDALANGSDELAQLESASAW
ncbi:DUF6541 family protein [Corynebacterium mayonis]|uniref:DUF6541 family protein n=1 Tax=Corynebacterium mayonis TaxID=3062461 RepID=UPI003140539F